MDESEQSVLGHSWSYPWLQANCGQRGLQENEPNATYAVLAENAAFDPKSKIAGVASPVYDAIQNFILPSVNGQLEPEEAIEMMKETLEPQIE